VIYNPFNILIITSKIFSFIKMRKIIFLIIGLNFFLTQAQEYSFINKNFVVIDKYKYLYYVQRKADVKTFTEEGKIISPTQLDSLDKTYIKQPFKKIFFADSINNKVSLVIKNLSKEEYKSINDKFQESQKKDLANRKKLKGSNIEKLDLTDINGNKYTLESLKGKIVVLNFWYTKCVPCIKEMPDLNKLKNKYQAENVIFFAITFDKENIVKPFLEKIKLDFTIIPNDKKTVNQFNISFFPTNIVIDKNGEVIFINELFEGNGIDKIDKILKKQLKKNT